MSIAAFAIQFLWNGLTAGEMLCRIDHMGVWDAVTVLPGFTNVINNEPQTFVEENVYIETLTDIG